MGWTKFFPFIIPNLHTYSIEFFQTFNQKPQPANLSPIVKGRKNVKKLKFQRRYKH